MSIDSIAEAAKDYFTADVATTMVAIAMAESGGQDDAEGDNLSGFTPAEQAGYEPFAVDGWLSFGAWQIFLGVHTQMVEKLAMTRDKEELKLWLFVAKNNAQAAREVFDSQGYQAWSTYNNGAYLQHMPEAAVAIAKATGDIRPAPDAQVVAFSVNGDVLHLDLSDGSFLETRTNRVGQFGGWLRFDFTDSFAVKRS